MNELTPSRSLGDEQSELVFQEALSQVRKQMSSKTQRQDLQAHGWRGIQCLPTTEEDLEIPSS